jgi:hypothetical protein
LAQSQPPDLWILQGRYQLLKRRSSQRTTCPDVLNNVCGAEEIKMSDPTFEVNLCLNAHSHVNTPAALKRRLAAVLACLRRHGPTEFKIYEPTVMGVKFRLFRARVQAEHWDVAEIYSLSERIQQDSISLFSPGRNEGAVIGPRADEWGEFILAKFSRFDWAADVAAKKAAEDVRPEPTSAYLIELEGIKEMQADLWHPALGRVAA